MSTELAIPALGHGQNNHPTAESIGSMNCKGQDNMESFATKLRQSRQSAENEQETTLDEEPIKKQHTSSVTHQLYYGQPISTELGSGIDCGVWEPIGGVVADNKDGTRLAMIEELGEDNLTDEACLSEAMGQVLPQRSVAQEGGLPLNSHGATRLEDVQSWSPELAVFDSDSLHALPGETWNYRLEGKVQATLDAPNALVSVGDNSTGDPRLPSNAAQNSIAEMVEDSRLLQLLGAKYQSSKIGIADGKATKSHGKLVDRHPLAPSGVPGGEMAWQSQGGGTSAGKAKVFAPLREADYVLEPDIDISADSPNPEDRIPAMGPSEEVNQLSVEEFGRIVMEVPESERALSLGETPRLEPRSSPESSSPTAVAIENMHQNPVKGQTLSVAEADLPADRHLEEPGISDADFSPTFRGEREISELHQYGKIPPQPPDAAIGEAESTYQVSATLVGVTTPAKDEGTDGKLEPLAQGVSPSPVVSREMPIQVGPEENNSDGTRHDLSDNPSLDGAEPEPLLSGDRWTEIEESMDTESKQSEEMRDVASGAKHPIQPEAALDTRSIESVSSAEVKSQRSIPDGPVAARQVIDQVIQKIQLDIKGEYGEIRLQLKPEHLGELKIKIATDNGIVSATFLAESHTVKNLIEAGLPHLRQQLMQQGLNVQDVFVQVGGGSSHGNQSYGGNPNPGLSNGWFQGSTGSPDEVGAASGTRRYLWGNTIDYRA